MFICSNCDSIDKFELMFNPDYQGSRAFEVTKNGTGKLEITVGDYTFSPDLMFMQNHAVCRYCGEINSWESE